MKPFICPEKNKSPCTLQYACGHLGPNIVKSCKDRKMKQQHIHKKISLRQYFQLSIYQLIISDWTENWNGLKTGVSVGPVLEYIELLSQTGPDSRLVLKWTKTGSDIWLDSGPGTGFDLVLPECRCVYGGVCPILSPIRGFLLLMTSRWMRRLWYLLFLNKHTHTPMMISCSVNWFSVLWLLWFIWCCSTGKFCFTQTTHNQRFLPEHRSINKPY